MEYFVIWCGIYRVPAGRVADCLRPSRDGPHQIPNDRRRSTGRREGRRGAEELTDIEAPRAVPSTLRRWLSYPISEIERFTMSREGLRSETFQFFETWAVLVDNSKAQRELGIQHRPLEEGVRASLDGGLKQQGMDRPLDSTPTP
ncbi:MAG: hypothetical protein ACI9PP_000879 [Halobacteriales archaeon]|jgi:hypothetical protein